MASYNPDFLIDQQTGEPDKLYISQVALARARNEYGAVEVPPVYLRQATQYFDDLAFTMRQKWRREHGLPDDAAYVQIESYAKPQDGVRREAF
jgi:hypothetical protein